MSPLIRFASICLLQFESNAILSLMMSFGLSDRPPSNFCVMVVSDLYALCAAFLALIPSSSYPGHLNRPSSSPFGMAFSALCTRRAARLATLLVYLPASWRFAAARRSLGDT